MYELNCGNLSHMDMKAHCVLMYSTEGHIYQIVKSPDTKPNLVGGVLRRIRKGGLLQLWFGILFYWYMAVILVQ